MRKGTITVWPDWATIWAIFESRQCLSLEPILVIGTAIVDWDVLN